MSQQTHEASIIERSDSPAERGEAFASHLADVLEAAKQAGTSEDVTKAAIQALAQVVTR